MKKLLFLAVLACVMFLGAAAANAGGRIADHGQVDHVGDFN